MSFRPVSLSFPESLLSLAGILCSVEFFFPWFELWVQWTILYYEEWPSLSLLFYCCICKALKAGFFTWRAVGGQWSRRGRQSPLSALTGSDQNSTINCSIKQLEVTLFLYVAYKGNWNAEIRFIFFPQVYLWFCFFFVFLMGNVFVCRVDKHIPSRHRADFSNVSL